MTTTLQDHAEQQIAEFLRTYRSLCEDTGERILSRRSITIAAVANFARDLTIAEWRSDDDWTVTLDGTGHCEHAQIDRTGQNILLNCTPEDRARRLEFCGAMFSQGCGLRAVLTEKFDDGSLAKTDTITLPLLDDGVRKILTFGVLIEDVDDSDRDRPTLRSSEFNDCQLIPLDELAA